MDSNQLIEISEKIVIVTGSAGFIGFHTSLKLLAEGWTVVGIDNLNDYYDVNLKYARLSKLCAFEKFISIPKNIEWRLEL